MTLKTPLTRLGLVLGAGAMLSYALAAILNWREFAVLALGFGSALLAAVPFILSVGSLSIVRSLAPSRVEVGGTARSALTLANTGRRALSPRTIQDSLDGLPWYHEVPAIPAGNSSVIESDLPTARRGVLAVGPAHVVKSDPLGLMRRSLGQAGEQRLWIYPRSTPLASLRTGFAKDLEGPTSDTSPAGDVAFHTIREYSDGDDIRHVHWLSTAKTGTLMVRHYVDNRRPYLGLVVDNDARALSPDGFELALEIAASHLRSAELDGRPVAVVVGQQDIVTAVSPAGTDDALDRLCLSELIEDEEQPTLIDIAERLRVVAPEVSAVLLVTGHRSAGELLGVVNAVRRHGRVIVARVVPPDAEPVAVPGGRVVDCHGLEGFATLWRGLVA